MNVALKRVFQYGIFIAIAALFLWLANRNLDFEKVISYLRGVHYWPLLLVFFGGIGSHYLRALRWKLLIEPLGYSVNTTNTFLSIMIGYAVNIVTPRGGEVARCAVLSRYENIPADKLAGTMIIERLIDLFTLIIVLALNYVFEYRYINTYFKTTLGKAWDNLSSKMNATNILILIGLFGLVMLLAFFLRKKLKQSENNKFLKIIQNIGQGISSIRKLDNVGTFIIYSASIWALYWFMTYMGFHAFDDLRDLRFGAGLSVLSFGSMGFVLPSPGGIGTFQYFVQEALVNIYAIEENLALAYANVSWAAQTLILVIGGLFSFVFIPIFNRNKKNKEDLSQN